MTLSGVNLTTGLKIPTTEGAILTLFIEFARHSKQSTPQQLAEFCRQEIGLSNEDVVKHICQTFEKVHKRITFYLLQTTRLDYDYLRNCNHNQTQRALMV